MFKSLKEVICYEMILVYNSTTLFELFVCAFLIATSWKRASDRVVWKAGATALKSYAVQ